MSLKVTFDPAKRLVTLRERGIDFATDAEKVFAGRVATVIDDRFDYGEVRNSTAGLAERPNGDGDLDCARRRPPHHFDEVLPCQRNQKAPQNSSSKRKPWVDPDDAPEWTDEMVARAEIREGDRIIRRGRPPLGDKGQGRGDDAARCRRAGILPGARRRMADADQRRPAPRAQTQERHDWPITYAEDVMRRCSGPAHPSLFAELVESEIAHGIGSTPQPRRVAKGYRDAPNRRKIPAFPCHFAPLRLERRHVRGPRTPGGLLRRRNGPQCGL